MADRAVAILEYKVFQAAVAPLGNLPLPRQVEQIVGVGGDDVALAARVLAVLRRQHQHAVSNRPARPAGVGLLVDSPAVQGLAVEERERRFAAAFGGSTGWPGLIGPDRHKERAGERDDRNDGAEAHVVPSWCCRPGCEAWPESNLIAQRACPEYVLAS